MGNGVVINASKDIMPFVKKRLKNKNKLEILNAQFVSNFNLYHLPDLENRTPVVLNPDFEYKIVEQAEIHDYYKYKGLTNALHYDKNCVTPETLAVAVFDGDKLLGIAAAKADCETMCQIGVDVYPEYRNKGLASSMVALLTDELLNRGYIPYYFLYCGNIASERTALAAGYFPVWLHCYKTRLFGKPFTWLNYLRFSQ